jgi:hypothetical protein
MKSVLLALVLLPVMAAQTPAPVPAAPTGPAPTRADATSDPLDALVADSPFGAPAGGNRGGPAGATGPLELRSIVFVDGAYQFSIFDQGTGKAEWVKIGETGLPFVARSFDRERDALTVEHRGRTLVLALQPAKMGTVAGGAPSAPPSPLPGANRNGPAQPNNVNAAAPNGPPGGSGNNAGPRATPPPASSTSAAEAQRLQNLADEIRRRRGTGPQLVLPKNQP